MIECTEPEALNSNIWAFEEYEIVIDTEVIPKSKSEKSDKSKLDEYEKLLESGKTGTMGMLK